MRKREKDTHTHEGPEQNAHRGSTPVLGKAAYFVAGDFSAGLAAETW